MPSLKEEFNPEEASAEWMWPDASRIKTQDSAAAEYDLCQKRAVWSSCVNVSATINL